MSFQQLCAATSLYSSTGCQKIERGIHLNFRTYEVHQIRAEALKTKIDDAGLMPQSNEDGGIPLNLRFEIDLQSAELFGRVETEHTSPELTEIAQNIWKSIDSISRKDGIVADTIEKFAKAGKHLEAAEAFLGDEAQAALYFSLGKSIFKAATNIDRNALEANLKRNFLLQYIALGTRVEKYHLIMDEIKELLRDESLDKPIRFSLQNTLAVSVLKSGAATAAIKMWQELLKSAHEIEAGERGWIYRNLGSAFTKMGNQASLASAEINLRHSADAFIEAGQLNEAARSLGQMAKLFEKRSAEEAIGKYDEMIAILNNKGSLADEVKASVYHGKAKRLLELGLHKAAKETALEAVKFRRGLLGAEDQLMSSLSLVKIASDFEGDTTTSDEIGEEITALQANTKSQYFDIANRISELFNSYDPESAAQILEQAKASNDLDLIVSTRLAMIIKDQALSNTEKLASFEFLHHEVQSKNANARILEPVRIAIATVLTEDSDFRGAAEWYRKILKEQPLDAKTGMALINVLWKGEQWGDAAVFLGEQIERLGEKPGYLYAYGRSLFEAGDLNNAIKQLTRCLNLAPEGGEIRSSATELREKALNLGGSIPTDHALPKAPAPITIEAIKEAINDFATFVSAAKRKAFWKKDEKKSSHQLVSRPESLGQTLLHTFFTARFGNRTRVFEEVGAGAGRLDILAQFDTGLTVIIELKMCGETYSATYARSGENQIRHYMQNLNVNLGFLTVFDARKRDNGVRLLQHSEEQATVHEVLIDIRPTVT